MYRNMRTVPNIFLPSMYCIFVLLRRGKTMSLSNWVANGPFVRG
jgi:hypothetical protein